jgi:AraC-like DNA-binding protein
LTPAGAYRLFAVPLHTLARRTVSLDEVVGRWADELVERLYEADWDARFRLVEGALTQRIADARPPSPGVEFAWRRLNETRGTLRVRGLCDELGWSPKRLATRFREEVGVPAKTLARLLRFEHAAELLDARPPRSLAEVAYACGYYDQSHLTNEFREITGRSPAVFRRATNEVTFFQDSAAVAA